MATQKTVQATVDFDVPVEEDSEYFVEAKQGSSPFVEVAKGEVSPIRYSAKVNAGIYTIRMFTRAISDKTKIFGPSPEASVVIPKSVPGNIKLTVVISK
jgi:hypothetical protein